MAPTPNTTTFAEFMASQKPPSGQAPNATNPRAARYANSQRAATFSPNDHAAPVLAGEPSLDDSQRADLHDLFHAVPSTTELAVHLAQLNLSHDLKSRLLTAKNQSVLVAPPQSAVDKTDAAITHLAQMDPQVRDMAEKSPHLLGHYLSAFQQEQK